MRPFVRAFLPILILVAAFFGVRALWQGGEDPMGFQRPPSVTRVEAVTLKLESYQVYISSQGVVEPRTQSTLIPEVPGKVIEISSALREGGFLTKVKSFCGSILWIMKLRLWWPNVRWLSRRP